MSEGKGRGPGINVPPPTFYVLGLIISLLLERYAVDLLPESRPVVQSTVEMTGVVLIVAGLALVVWGALTFRGKQTAIFPNRDASRVVTSGPYRWTRNPMYCGMALAYLGICLLFSLGWGFVVFPFVLLAITRLVIMREERYLTGAFGEDYNAYRRRVRRWL